LYLESPLCLPPLRSPAGAAVSYPGAIADGKGLALALRKPWKPVAIFAKVWPSNAFKIKTIVEKRL
jgi:hypothetical protein